MNKKYLTFEKHIQDIYRRIINFGTKYDYSSADDSNISDSELGMSEHEELANNIFKNKKVLYIKKPKKEKSQFNSNNINFEL